MKTTVKTAPSGKVYEEKGLPIMTNVPPMPKYTAPQVRVQQAPLPQLTQETTQNPSAQSAA